MGILHKLQFLDAVSIFPRLYGPLEKETCRSEIDFEAGIRAVARSNDYTEELTSEIAEKEPQVAQLSSEIDQLGKRLGTERMNLDRASKVGEFTISPILMHQYFKTVATVLNHRIIERFDYEDNSLDLMENN